MESFAVYLMGEGKDEARRETVKMVTVEDNDGERKAGGRLRE